MLSLIQILLIQVILCFVENYVLILRNTLACYSVASFRQRVLKHALQLERFSTFNMDWFQSFSGSFIFGKLQGILFLRHPGFWEREYLSKFDKTFIFYFLLNTLP
jgi:hypothetical protein